MPGKRIASALRIMLPGLALGVLVASGFAGGAKNDTKIEDRRNLPKGAIQRLGSLHWRHGEPITFLAYAADGKTLLTATHDSVVRLWDRETGREIRRFVPNAEPNAKGVALAQLYSQGITRAAISNDGKQLAVALPSNVVQLWDVETGKELRQIKGPADGVGSIGFAPDGKTLALRGASDRVCHLYETETGKALHKLKAVSPLGKGGNISGGPTNGTGLAFSPNGKIIALPELEFINQVVIGSVTLFHVDTGKEFKRIEPPTHGIGAIAFSPDGKSLVFNTHSSLHIYDAEKGKEIRKLNAFFGAHLALFGPDGQTLAVKSRDHLVRLFDPRTGNLIRTLGELPGQKGGNVFVNSNNAVPTDVAYSPDGKTLVIGGQQVPRFFDVATGKELQLPGGGHGGAVTALMVSTDGKTVVSRGAEGALRSWDATTSTEKRFIAEPAGTSAVRLAPDGKTVALGNNDGTVRLLDVADGKQIRQFKAHQGTIANLAFSANGKQLATRGSYDGLLHIFDVQKGAELKKFVCQDIKPANGGVVFLRGSQAQADGHPLAFSPDGKILAAFIAPHQVQVQGQPQANPDANCLCLYDVDTGRDMRKILMPTGLVIQHLVFSRDGRLLMSENLDKTISVWEVASGQERSRLGKPVSIPPQTSTTNFVVINGIARSGPHTRPVGVTIATSPDGRLIAAPGANSSINVFDAFSGKEVATFQGHDGAIASLVFAADGRTLLSGGYDTTILAWNLIDRKPASDATIADLQAKEIDELWADLIGSDARRAGLAVHAFVSRPKMAVAILNERIQPAKPADPKAVEQWLRDLDSGVFAKRAFAMRELKRNAELALPALQRALESQPSLELQRRVESLLAELQGSNLSPEQIRVVRSIEVLERIDTAEARQVLEKLAGGAPGSLTTRESQKSLQRGAATKASK